MAKRNLASKVRRKIILATSLSIFTLADVVAASFAWFLNARTRAINASMFEVTSTGTCYLESVNLIKFNFATEEALDGTVIVKYDSPREGEVKRYEFNTTYNKFGEMVDGVWQAVEVMNIYDPVERIIKGSSFDLKDLNSNAVYELTFVVYSGGSYSVNMHSNLISNKTKTDSQIYLSECIDFDGYTEEELDASIGTDGTGKPLYYPDYLADDYDMSEEEEIYYRTSYFSSLEESHAHYYTDGEKPHSIDVVSNKSATVSSSDARYKVYINANYAPNQLEEYVKNLYLSNIRAVYDFGFSCTFNLDGGLGS